MPPQTDAICYCPILYFCIYLDNNKYTLAKII